ncbi:hypothetical protein [Streptomyces aidingensis]|nr:hypothetical protein [Streptomyces aidingensis]
MTTVAGWRGLIGARVRDTTTERTGLLMDVLKEPVSAPGCATVAWAVRAYLRPVQGGTEWVTDPKNLEVIEPHALHRPVRHPAAGAPSPDPASVPAPVPGLRPSPAAAEPPG